MFKQLKNKISAIEDEHGTICVSSSGLTIDGKENLQ